MARALARGWGEPVLCSDAGSGRAAALAARARRRGRSLEPSRSPSGPTSSCCATSRRSSSEVAARSPGTPRPSPRSSAASTAGALHEAYPGVAGVPLDAEHAGRGASRRDLLRAAPDEVDARAGGARCSRCSSGSGAVVKVPERLIDAAGGGRWASGPAYQALLAEAQVDAAVRHGLDAGAGQPAGGRDDGRHAPRCSQARDYDTLAVRREVTSPGRDRPPAGWRRSSAAACGRVPGRDRRACVGAGR